MPSVTWLNIMMWKNSTTVRLISFYEPDHIGSYLSIKKDKIILPTIRENILLDRSSNDSLTSLFYNVGRTPVKGLGAGLITEAACYEPRNAILFLKSGKVFEYIEVCFECMDYKKSSKRIEIWCYCLQKYDLLKAFFKDKGLRIGTTKERPF